MEQAIYETVTDTKILHDFFCDECNKHLGRSEEYSDGYYKSFGDFNLSIRMPNGYYEVNKCLCDECKVKYVDKLATALENLGFEPSGY